MQYRTDLAVEAEDCLSELDGVDCREYVEGDVTITETLIRTRSASECTGKPIGEYVTLAMPPLTGHAFMPDERYEMISFQLRRLLPDEGTVLVAGLGNSGVTPDALGSRTVSKILATRHIAGEYAESAGLGGLRPAAVIAAGVLGQTGIESAELLRAVCGAIEPQAVIIIDALAARDLSRLGSTVQMSSTGIAPGSGVGNDRPRIDSGLLGVPVISLGVPTVVDAESIAGEKAALRGGMMVTPREIDLLIDRAASLLAMAINHALYPAVDPADMLAIMS